MNFKNIILLSLTVAFCTLMACSGSDDDGPSDPTLTEEEAAVLANLVDTWSNPSVIKDDEAVPAEKLDFSGMTLTYGANLETGADKTYTVTGGTVVFPDIAGASWSFVEGSNYEVIQNADGSQLRIVSVSETELVIRQQVEVEIPLEEAAARVRTIGTYIYTFTK